MPNDSGGHYAEASKQLNQSDLKCCANWLAVGRVVDVGTLFVSQEFVYNLLEVRRSRHW